MNIQPDILESRKPPHSIEAEQALLGAMLMNNDVVDRLHFLSPHHFFEAVHERIYEHVLVMREKLQTASPITLKPFFESDEALAEVGGAAYLGKLATSAVNIFNIEELAQLVVDMHDRRQLINIGEEMVNTAYEADIDISANDQIEGSEQRLFDLSEKRDVEGGFKSFSASMTEAIDLIEKARKSGGKVSGKTTGLRLLNHKIGGFHDSDLIVLAGRPGMGKSALATSVGFYCAQALRRDLDDGVSAEDSRGAVVGFFSLEMSADQLATRILSQQSAVSSEELRKGNINTEEFQRVAAASTRLQELPFFIDDTPGLSIAALRARARRLHRRHNLGLIVVDYLQLLQATNSKGRQPENRVQEISEITRGLKNIAKSLRVPVIALSQLSRAVEQREDKKPQLADLRESGTIEQDADIVLFIYREAYYHMRKKPDEADDSFIDWQKKAIDIEEHAEIDVAKHRHGATGSVKVRFNAQSAAFEDLPDADPNYLPERTR
ncbi:MAG: replicative DNA helicase [Pseudomonadota bacterium]